MRVLEQTSLVPVKKVKEDLNGWRESMKAELDGLLVSALEEIKPEDLAKELAESEYIPMMSVHSLKHGTKKKTRAVLRGDLSAVQVPVATPVVTAEVLRTVSTVAAGRQWSIYNADFRAAFLNAPLPEGRRVVTSLPEAFIAAGLGTSSQRFRVKKAVYGLREAPRCWGSCRDKVLASLTTSVDGNSYYLEQTLHDEGCWKIIDAATQRVIGFLIVYVDDILLSSENDAVCESLLKKLSQHFELSLAEVIRPAQKSKGTSEGQKEGEAKEVEMTNYRGVELSYVVVNGASVLRTSMDKYVAALLRKYELTEANVAKSPCGDMSFSESQLPSSVNLRELRTAQVLTGELMWLSQQLRGDLAYPVLRIAQTTMRAPALSISWSKRVLRYVRGTSSYAIHAGAWDSTPVQPPSSYGAIEDACARRGGHVQRPPVEALVRAYSDASFAPFSAKSVSGNLVMVGATPVSWRSSQQSVLATSSCEAEVYAQAEGVGAALSIAELLRELGVQTTVSGFCDNTAAITQVGLSGGWRSRHYAIRARSLLNHVETGRFSLNHLSGKRMPADGLTKALSADLQGLFAKY